MKMLASIALAAALLMPTAGSSQPSGMRAEMLEPHLVEVQPGRHLNLRCSGAGSPTVVFEQGGEGMIYNWAKVQPRIETMTRTCVYDRGGFGWSDAPHYPVTAISVTDDLHTLLRNGGVRGPIILVGHSVGGFYATMYADRFFDEVVGLVLIEPGFNGQTSGMQGERRDAEQANVRRGEGDLLRCAELARSGKLTPENLDLNGCFSPPSESEGGAVRRYGLHAILSPNWYLAEHSQSVNYIRADDRLSVSQAQEHDARRSFGALPLVVLSAATFASDPWRTDQENAAAQAIWLAGHADLVKRSSGGRHVNVEGSGHFIQLDRPQVVVDAIRDVLARARSRQAERNRRQP